MLLVSVLVIVVGLARSVALRSPEGGAFRAKRRARPTTAAARANGALFFPVNPGHEEQSWERFFREGCQRFFNHTFAGDYEASLIAEFEKLLPEQPPWR